MSTTWLNIQNFASSTLVAPIIDTDTSLTVQAGEGSLFGSAPFHVVIGDESQGYEVVKVTGVDGDIFSILRAQEATTALSFDVGTPVRLAVTAEYVTEVRDAVNNIEDGTTTLDSVTASGAIEGSTLTDGTASISAGEISDATDITASGTIQGGILTDGTATISSGAVSGVTTLETTGDVTVGGNDIKSNGGTTAISLSGEDVEIKGILKHGGDELYTYANTFTNHWCRHRKRNKFTAAGYQRLCEIDLTNNVYDGAILTGSITAHYYATSKGKVEFTINISRASAIYYERFTKTLIKGNIDLYLKRMSTGVYEVWVQSTNAGELRWVSDVQHYQFYTVNDFDFSGEGESVTPNGETDIPPSETIEFANDVEFDGSIAAGDGGFNVAADGFVTFADDARYVKGVHLPSENLSHPSANAPEDVVINNMAFARAFDPDTKEILYAKFEIPPDLDPTSPIKARIQWAPEDSNSGNVVWGFDYQLLKVDNETLDDGKDDTVTVTDVAGGTRYLYQKTDMVTFSEIDTPAAGDILLLKVFRDATNASDTYGSDALLIGICIGYVANKFGKDERW